MKIKRLTLHNFGVYAGTNTFEFHGEKPVVLIGGMNGRGKTTFLEAVLLALYSSKSFAYTEGKFMTYGQYLKSFVNTADGTCQTYIELEFDLTEKETYVVHRNWNGKLQRIRENIQVYLNGEVNSFLTENWSMFIENILPSGLSNFFFFDGEKIAALAEEDTNEQMKESIRILLGIDIVDKLEVDLKRISKRAEAKNVKKYSIKKSEQLKDIKESAEAKLDELDNRISIVQSEIVEVEKKLEIERSNYSTKGGDIIEKQQKLFQEKSSIGMQIQNINEQLLEIAGSALPLSMTADLLKKIELQSKQERNNRENEIVAKKMEYLYKAFDVDKRSDDVEKFMKYIELHMKTKQVEEIYSLSDMSYLQVCNLNNELLFDLKKRAKYLMKEKKKLRRKEAELDSYLSIEIDEKAINKIYKSILKLEKKKSNLEVERDECLKKRPALNGNVIKASAEFNKYVEEVLASLELRDDNERVVKYTYKVIDVMETYKIRLQERKVKELADTMTKCYKMLANKKRLISYIKMDAETLDFMYYNENGEFVSKNRLSAGEKQLMVVALLWSLALCSKRKLPVIIDTPLSRLDAKHRIALIRTYFPNASDQTIILSTDSEIFGKYYEALKENVGDEYTLCYDDEAMCTSIEKGYKMEEVQW